MDLIISLDGSDIKLILKDGEKVSAERGWHGEHALSEKLLGEIEELLAECSVQKEEVARIIPQISSVSGVTSRRIVEAVAKAWDLAVKY